MKRRGRRESKKRLSCVRIYHSEYSAAFGGWESGKACGCKSVIIAEMVCQF